MTRWIAGLDGCRGAWAGALLDLDDPARFRAARFPTIPDLMNAPGAPSVVGIDVPIGLPDRVTGKGRDADRAARALLGASRSSVFPVPPRAAVFAKDYEAAKAISRQMSDPPFAPSIQCWNILKYVREADVVLRLRPDWRARLFEVHPEVAFFVMNGAVPLTGSKRTPAGLAARRDLLHAAGLPEALVAARPQGVGADDHLDACAALLVARDIANGRARALPPEPQGDAFGLPIAIWIPAAAA